ncbi:MULTISPECIES: hypothetical protein [Rhodococcus]|uniref:hypothetical protein n=1 Tax=Rhodococcus TaxID=1827 RepID=UPI00143E2C8F|nr:MULTISPECIES: hypothetical protein [Rhodococcus]QIX48911.1 hypothetical protein HFP48_04645 [Rhodococcus sp. DMU1]QRI76038.1 hypothetical protein JQ505_26785 [Rhodococcus aetherivorans]QSE59449.1 hypothetical protein JYA75_27885 [Rhodococcus sp. PSBB066]QSE69226.1 hypothetical protein JYA91_27570 [Rhodococcus sp. PSBB049]USC16202.1 hypothetical protein KZJ41_04565 [Rhodococcus sp. 11-3]
MNLPIYEQTRRTVPCALLCDNTPVPADELEELDVDVELDHLPVFVGRPNELPSVWWSILAMVGLVGMLAFIMYAAAVSS